ncbi:uncharacterized protein SOCE26_016450 [Sorangium cellulosum]|uniref:Kazal-like domain-containing protein n=1 Tax=Sorangium cellulosum TaxID=56 RepID=A0A2L0ELS0_SORCE|nr:hypothetical protein [Sorangium cellulosum]AUX40246.1 uncharacterized protein SOCE26_016450 [Sorangium cellulosum]
MRRFNGLGVLLALVASGCAAPVEFDEVGAAEGALAPGGEDAASAALSGDEEGGAAGAGGAAWVEARGRGSETGPSIAGKGESCGGFTIGPAPVCAQGLYCSFRFEDVCGWADASGTCAERPASCTEEHATVCGCDGRVYKNACVAAMSGVAVYVEGACEGAAVPGSPAAVRSALAE